MLDNWVKLRILVSHIFRHQGIFYCDCVIHGTWEFHFPGDVGVGGGGGARLPY